MYKIIITLLLCCCATVYGAEVDNALLKKNLEAATIQIEVLKSQVDVMKSYQDKFLSTVYWSLGTVAALVVFLAGFNWFTNNRNAEKESSLHKEMISNELNNITNTLNNKFLDHLSENKVKQDAAIENLKNDLENLFARDLNNKLRPIDRDLKKIKRQLYESQYNEYMEKKYYSNALVVVCNLLDLSVDDYDFQSNTTDALAKVETTLKVAKENHHLNRIKPNTIAQITSSLIPFEDKHGIVIKRIHQQLSGIE
ncbi:hypothetical protein [Acinetobacter sp. YH12140]|uniref:hypothetical protein n=1 Tax=Acinetobacter sp. YH12140 TaxID=2601124 RepID=UPI0015D1BFB6|nr:hypothetical protein [Acinetobacter sp. YH12140]